MKFLKAALISSLSSFTAHSALADSTLIEPAVEDNSFIVVWESTKSLQSNRSFKANGQRSSKVMPNLGNVEVIQLTTTSDLKTAIDSYEAMAGVKAVYPNYIYTIDQLPESVNLPDDPFLPQLWGLDSPVEGFDINAPEAWSITTGDEEVVIAVIDSGIDYSHPDLVDNLWVNPLEIPGNGLDDDSNGYIDDIYGIDSHNGDSDPFDDNSHGTHVAGTIAAQGNNGAGVTGVAWNAKIVSCKFLGASGSGSTAGAIECLDYILGLKHRGENIVATNNSWGGSFFDQTLFDAIERHSNEDLLFVAAAGNSARDNDTTESYPTNYELPNIISVAAMNVLGDRAWFSNYGITTVDLFAPGESIYSTYPGDRYEYLDGTSMAAPHVTGALALLASQGQTGQLAKAVLLATTAEHSALEGLTANGILNLWGENGSGALNCENFIKIGRQIPASNDININVGSTQVIAFTHVNCAIPNGSLDISVAGTTYTLADEGQNGDQIAGDGVYSVEVEVSWIGNALVEVVDHPAFNFYINGVIEPQFTSTPYEYIDITGTRINASDDSSHLINLEFDIQLPYMEPVSSFYISSNGIISFDGSISSWSNTQLPLSSPSRLALPYWDDLYPLPEETGGIFYEIIGQAPERQVIVEYRNVTRCCSSESSDDYRITFQAVFYEARSQVQFNYRDVSADAIFGFSNGLGATIGFQGDDLVSQYSYNEAVIEDQTSLQFAISEISFTALEIATDGVLRPHMPITFNVTNLNDESNFSGIEIDIADGRGFTEYDPDNPPVAVYASAGLYSVAARVTSDQEPITTFATVEILPFTDTEETIFTEALNQGTSNVVNNPLLYGLMSEEAANQAVAEAAAQAQIDQLNAIADEPSNFGYVTIENSEIAALVAMESGRQEVLMAPQTFGLITSNESDALVDAARQEGREQVLNAPHSFGLSTIVNDPSDIDQLTVGTHLLGSPVEILDLDQYFSSARIIWIYNQGSFRGWSPSQEIRTRITNSGYELIEAIEAGEGIWVKK